ncbi:type II toxin-antitoxin system antitoxin SocA domain-containing protein [Thioalkalivibrio sp. HK1]|uniref:type II toxin-antitoxin system antitoxin SocA domain-containing protein n=1 Tax=Thioalkalivibrio sp. HK1 TaxID=1469245 RepID=UPI00046E605D|nr:Panacea domain-containing protein [Thioalkalivibrio sp. HK1]
MNHPITPPPIRFRFAPKKCLQAVQWMLLTANEPLDFQTILKAAYFADKRMLNKHRRPIFGATYRAMNYGPVPVEVYEMLIEEPYHLSELDLDDYPWKRKGHRVSLIDSGHQDEILNPTSIAEADLAFLEEEFERSRGMSFNQRTEETHQMDWVRGIERPDSRMAYEDMIAYDHPHRKEMIEDLTSIGVRIVL